MVSHGLTDNGLKATSRLDQHMLNKAPVCGWRLFYFLVRARLFVPSTASVRALKPSMDKGSEETVVWAAKGFTCRNMIIMMSSCRYMESSPFQGKTCSCTCAGNSDGNPSLSQSLAIAEQCIDEAR